MVTLSLLRLLTEEDLTDIPILTTTVVATRLDGSNGQTSVIVTFDPIAVPKFSKSSFRGSLDDTYILTFEDVVIDITTFSADIQYTLEGG